MGRILPRPFVRDQTPSSQQLTRRDRPGKKNSIALQASSKGKADRTADHDLRAASHRIHKMPQFVPECFDFSCVVHHCAA